MELLDIAFGIALIILVVALAAPHVVIPIILALRVPLDKEEGE